MPWLSEDWHRSPRVSDIAETFVEPTQGLLLFRTVYLRLRGRPSQDLDALVIRFPIDGEGNAIIEGATNGGSDTAAVPIVTQDTTKGLKPAGVRNPPQHLRRPEISHNENRDLSGQLGHPLKQPGRCLAVV